MSFIKKDVNFGLLFIVIVLALAIASLGLYYNYNYSSLADNYNSQLSRLQKVTDDLLFHRSRLNQTASILQTKEQDEAELNKKYNDLRDDNEKLESDNEIYRQDIAKKNIDLVEKSNQLINAQSQIATLGREAVLCEARVRSYKSKFERTCEGDFSDCD